jgi:hypothetical protein
MRDMKPGPILCLLLVIGIMTPGCFEDSGVSTPASNGVSCPDCCDDTAIAIGIALNDSEVRTYLADPYSIAEVNANATTTVLLDGTYSTIDTVDVMIDTPGNLVHVYVDNPNCTVISIWPQPKRISVEPVPNTTIINTVGDHLVGDVFTVNGTSPLPAGSLLFIEVIPVDFKPPPWEEHPGPKTTISDMIQTVEYRNGVSHWYYAVNTTMLLPNRYEIWIWSDPPYWTGVSTEFNLSGEEDG